MVPDELGQVFGRALLLALDEHLHRARQRALSEQRADRGRVHHDARLVVGGATAEQPAPADRRFEGRRGPRFRIGGRLHVVMGVQQQRRRSDGTGELTEDGGVTTFELEEAGVVEPGVAQDVGRRLGAVANVRRVVSGIPDRRDAHEPLEVGNRPGHVVGDPAAQVVGVHGGPD